MASTELRAAAQQALEAMTSRDGDSWTRRFARDRAIEALEAALAEHYCDTHCTWADHAPECPLAEPVQEPVAKVELMMTGGNAGLATRIVEIDDHLRERLRPGQLLYTSPPQRKPLTEEEIDSIWDSEKAFADIYAIARAIERAHGIDGAPEERNFCSRCGKRTNGIHTCTPPAPLTDEVIAELWHQNGGFHHHFARAIERWLKGNP